jgi:chromosomal replication initiator protein
MSARSTDELSDLWRRVRDELATALPASTVEMWVDPLRVVARRGSTLQLTAPKPVRAWVGRRYSEALLVAVRHQAPEIETVELVDDAAPGGRDERGVVPRSLPLDPRQTFDRFVIGPGNRVAHGAALAVAELPGEAYNPLFLHGPPGLGKSHLMAAIHGYMSRHHAGLTIHHTTAERFTSEFVTALRRSGPEAFKARYRGLDALLIDDVEFLEGKEQTAEEFFHTFNALHAAGKQLVLSSDRPPGALSGLAERLRDRFAWGLTVEIEPPDLRTRIAVLWRLASDRAGELPEPAVLNEIAARVPGNVRVLEGAMTRVLALSSLLREPLTTSIVRQALDVDRGATPGRPTPSLEQIQDAVCAVHRISREELLSPRRSPRIAQTRQLAMYLARELTGLSLSDIARAFDRDHTTVMHAIRAVGARLEPGSEASSAVHKVCTSLGTVPPEVCGDDAAGSALPTDPQG